MGRGATSRGAKPPGRWGAGGGAPSWLRVTGPHALFRPNNLSASIAGVIGGLRRFLEAKRASRGRNKAWQAHAKPTDNSGAMTRSIEDGRWTATFRPRLKVQVLGTAFFALWLCLWAVGEAFSLAVLL